MNPIIQEVTASQVKKDITPFKVGDGVAVERAVAATRFGREHGDGDLGRGVPCKRPQQTLDPARVTA